MSKPRVRFRPDASGMREVERQLERSLESGDAGVTLRCPRCGSPVEVRGKADACPECGLVIRVGVGL